MQETTCEVDGCSSPVRTDEMCRIHYRQYRTHGYVLTATVKTKRQGTKHGAPYRFLQAVVADPPLDRCVPWPFERSTEGYGVVTHGRKMGAHRVALLLHQGPPPDESYHAAHAPKICHNPLCVNPNHLEWKTPAENQADRIIDGTHCRGERSPNAKLTEGAVEAILEDQRTHREIAECHAVSRSAVAAVKNGLTWTHLSGRSRNR